MTTVPKHIDVLIVGAGPVGMCAANLLAGYGINGIIVDKEMQIFDQPRAIALDNEALRILQWTGLTENSFKRIGVGSVKFKSPLFGEIARINSAGTIDCHPKLVTFVQPELEAALQVELDNKSKKGNDFSIIRGLSLIQGQQNEDGVEVELLDQDQSRHRIRCKYLIAADGANSFIRKSLGLDFKGGKRYNEDWLIVDVKNINNSNIIKPQDHIEFICDPKRSVPHMPAPGERERWEFKLNENENPDELMKDENINKLLLPWFPKQDAEIERKAVYRFQAKTAAQFSKGRIFLVGDAAHVTPPFVGQGLVAGLRDAANLSWKLAWVLKGMANEKILDTYDIERKPHAKAMIKLAVFAGRSIMPQNKLAAFIIHGLVALTSKLPILKRQLQELEIKPENGFKKGLFISGKHRLRRGHPLTQAMLSNSSGQTKLSDDIGGNKFRLVGFGFDPTEHLSDEFLSRWRSLGGEIIQICHKGQVLNRPNLDHCWEDQQGEILPNTAPLGWSAILRPDQIVMHDGPVEQVNEMVKQALEIMDVPSSLHHIPNKQCTANK